MNRKQFILLTGLVVVVGIAGLVTYKNQNASRAAGNATLGKKLLGDFPYNDVTHLTIKQGTNELNLVKKDDLWRVGERNNYPANYGQISEFLLKAGDLKIVQSEKVGPSQLGRLELLPAQGANPAVVVEFKDKNDKAMQTLLLGKKHMRQSKSPSPMGDDMDAGGWPDGRWVKVGASSESVCVISDPLANIEPKPENWLNKDFFKVEKVRSLAVSYPTATTNSWKLTRDTDSGDWKLADAKAGEQLDSAKTSALSSPLNAPSFADVDTTSKPEQLGLDKATLVTLETADHFTYNLKIGTKTNDNYPVVLSVSVQLPKERTPGKDEKPEDKARLDKEFKDSQKKLEDKLAQEKAYEKWTYLVSSWTMDSILKQRSELMQEKKEEPKKEEVSATGSSTNAPAPLAPLPTADAGAPAKAN